jgi:phenylacetate-CoA ligase
MGQLHAYLWGSSFEETTAHALRGRLIDWEWNRFLTNAFTLTEEKLAAFADEVERLHPRILFGYASSLHQFAQFIRQRPYREITFDGIVSSAEVLPQAVREMIEATFKCRVFNRYGTKELGGVACECDAHNGLHVSAENNRVEILVDDHPAKPGETGSIIVTNLNNWGMPFIRYSIGDEGSWGDESPCSCGRSSPRLEKVEGRIVDRFRTRDGRASWAGFAGDGYSSLLAQPEIKQFQIIQESYDKITVLLVKDGEIPAAVLDQLELRLRAAFGEEIVVEFQYPNEIPLLPSGKHQYAISRVGVPSETEFNAAVQSETKGR